LLAKGFTGDSGVKRFASKLAPTKSRPLSEKYGDA
jgi:hypothetical protein